MNAEKQIANVLGVLIATAAMAAAAQLSISLPESVSVAPITGQSLAILLVAHLLKWRLASISVLLYILLGAIGVPVFSDFSAGTEILFGKTAGYFFGFLMASLFVGYLANKQKKRFPYYLLQMSLGTIVILICGGIGLLRFLDFPDVLKYGIRPFLAGAFVKIIVGAMLLSAHRRFIALMNFEKPKS